MSTQSYWTALTTRDAKLDGEFVYGVRSTGIYCRPSCPSRKPKRENVTFFSLPELAEKAGYRACKRCDPSAPGGSPQVQKLRAVCRYLETHLEDAPTLTRLAEQFGLSASQLQRSFKRTVGITPKAYLDSCRLDALKGSLQRGEPVTSATFGAGYGSSSRLYSKSDSYLGMTPKTYQQKGKGMHVRYTVVNSPLGQLLVAATDKGLCSVRLGDETRLVSELENEFAGAKLTRDGAALDAEVTQILAYLEGKAPHLELPLDVQATAFQRQVWQALQTIPYGETRSYKEVAKAIGKPKAVRAVAGACAANPVALVVPCHRVVRSDGSLSGYRWGMKRKRALLEGEKTQCEEAA